MNLRLCGSLLLATLFSNGAAGALSPEPLVAARLPVQPRSHWVWMNDVVFQHMADGKAYLLDGDSGRFLGMLSTGYGYNGVVPAHRGGIIYSPESYFSRGTRGARTDVVTIYSDTDLSVVGEVPIPPKRSSQLALIPAAMLTDDDRFLLIYNFTPAQSVTVVDTRTRQFVGEVETAGCALTYSTGARSFFSICADGALLAVTLNETGQASATRRTEPVFDVTRDAVSERAVRVGSTWWFSSAQGQMMAVEATPEGPQGRRAWWLTTPEERASGWRPGGLQPLAAHSASRRLFVIMHQGGPDTRKDPGKEIWTYDLDTGRRLGRLSLQNIVSSIAVSQDASPLLFACFLGRNAMDVYDGNTGGFLRSVNEVGATPTTLVAP